MIVFKNQQLESQALVMAFNELMKMPHNHDVSWRLRKLIDNLETAVKAYLTAKQELIYKHSELDEKGEPKKIMEQKGENEDGTPKMVATGIMWKNEEEANEAFKQLALTEVVIEVTQFSMDQDFAGVKLLPAQWEAIDPILLPRPSQAS